MGEPVATAVSLMKMALALLDKAGEVGAACSLQHAIDQATQVPPMRPGDEIPSELIARMLPDDPPVSGG